MGSIEFNDLKHGLASCSNRRLLYGMLFTDRKSIREILNTHLLKSVAYDITFMYVFTHQSCHRKWFASLQGWHSRIVITDWDGFVSNVKPFIPYLLTIVIVQLQETDNHWPMKFRSTVICCIFSKSVTSHENHFIHNISVKFKITNEDIADGSDSHLRCLITVIFNPTNY